jgi:hypothetical protein
MCRNDAKTSCQRAVPTGLDALAIFSSFQNFILRCCGGEGGIRTHGGVAPTTVFETAPFDHSGTSPECLTYG